MIKAGLRRVPKFEEVLGKDTYDLDERLQYLGNAAKNYREGFFFTRHGAAKNYEKTSCRDEDQKKFTTAS